MTRNFDLELERLQPPEPLLSALTPPSDTVVSELFAISGPKQPGSRKIALQGLAWFSSNVPSNDTPLNIEDLVIPSPRQCRTIEDFLRPALEANLTAIEHPTQDNMYLPLWYARAFKWANRLLQSRVFWQERLNWIEVTAERENWAKDQREATSAAVMHSPWQAGLSHLQRGGVPINHLARVLLSDEWVTGEALDCMLDYSRLRFQESGVDASTQIAEASLCQKMEGGGRTGRVAYWGGELRDGRVRRLLLPWNIPQLHWFLFDIDIDNSTITVRDSKPRITKPHLEKILPILRQWLSDYRPNQDFLIQEGVDSLSVEEQLDSFSCGIACASTALTSGCPSLPRWNPSKPLEMRAYFFTSCVGGILNGDFQLREEVRSLQICRSGKWLTV